MLAEARFGAYGRLTPTGDNPTHPATSNTEQSNPQIIKDRFDRIQA